jgi:hypothetical protein
MLHWLDDGNAEKQKRWKEHQEMRRQAEEDYLQAEMRGRRTAAAAAPSLPRDEARKQAEDGEAAAAARKRKMDEDERFEKWVELHERWHEEGQRRTAKARAKELQRLNAEEPLGLLDWMVWKQQEEQEKEKHKHKFWKERELAASEQAEKHKQKQKL